MSRTLTVGAATPRRTIPTASTSGQDSQDQIVAWIFGSVADLWRYGKAWAKAHKEAEEQNQRTHKLFRQLQDPALQRHPKFPEARDRYYRWEQEFIRLKAAADAIEMVAEGVQRNLAKHLKRLSQRRRDDLLACPGWVRSDDMDKVAAGMWGKAKRQEVWPAGEAPFLSPEERRLSAERVGLSLAWIEVRETVNPVQCPF